jgi:hypothetical protein
VVQPVWCDHAIVVRESDILARRLSDSLVSSVSGTPILRKAEISDREIRELSCNVLKWSWARVIDQDDLAAKAGRPKGSQEISCLIRATMAWDH